MLILGIESSCDETAVALVRDGREIVLSHVASQIDLHAPYGGIVPEVACRAHAEWLVPLIQNALKDADCELADVDVIAATSQPGLIGALLVGLSAGKALAWALDKPFVAVDHIDGHIHATRMEHPEMLFPHLSLVVSGGHTEVYRSPDSCTKELITSTMDDAAGECFDKVAALLGLPYPGGPQIQKLAEQGDPTAVDFPRGKPGDDGMALSFSGLKTAVLYHLKREGFAQKAGRPRLEFTGKQAPQGVLADVAASFQECAVDMLIRVALAASKSTGIKHLGLTGGVACNSRLREKLAQACAQHGVTLYACPPKLCTDNAAFIAGAAHAFAQAGRFSPLDTEAVPN